MKQYNLYNLQASFSKFLITGNKKLSQISLKNYLSDLRHFFAWFYFKLKSNSIEFNNDEILVVIQSYFNKIYLVQYRSYLIENNIPNKSINRRLSTLRKLGKFCLSQGWIKEDPLKEISNISNVQNNNNAQYYKKNASSEILIKEYKKALQSQKYTTNHINEFVNDVNEFFSFIS